MANHEMSMESIDSGSNYSFGDKLIKPNAPKALFDLSFLSSMDMYNAGLMYPLCEPIECIMGDDIEISVASLLRVLPQEVPLYSRQRLYIYAFYSRCSDLWVNWNTFMKKGKLGKTIKEIPTLNSSNFKNGQYDSDDGEVVTGSLADYMGLPIGLDATGETWTGKINAMPFMMYLKIWRDYFSNQNALAGNTALFPDNDDDFRLDDDGRVISFKNQDYISGETEYHFNVIFNSSTVSLHDDADENRKAMYGVECELDDSKGNLKIGLFYHNWPDDRFTDALPWPQRGDTPTLDIIANGVFDESTGTSYANAVQLYRLGNTPSNPSNQKPLYMQQETLLWNGEVGSPSSDINYANSRSFYGLGSLGEEENEDFITMTTTDGKIGGFETKNYNLLGTPLKLGIRGEDIAAEMNSRLSAAINASVTLNQIRELAIAQTELEKMARTDGTYLGFALTFFGEKPKNSIEYKPVFIGGTYTDLNFTEVLQTGGSTENSPLGTYAGHGIAGNPIEKGYIGKIHCDDYGYIMILGCIMPDVYYTQKLDRMWTRKFQSDMYLPERAKMGMTPILNHEIDALHAPDGKTLFDLWAYNNPFDELRYRANEVHGQIADSNKASFFAYTQSRHFDAAPNWGKAFSEAKDVRMDYLAAGTTESAYTAQFKFNIKAVRALPYKPVPAQII